MTKNVQGVRKILLERPCTSRHVLSNFMYLFWIKFMWQELNFERIVFGFETARNYPKGHSKVLDEGTKIVAWHFQANPKQWPSRWPIVIVMPRHRMSSMGTYPLGGKGDFPATVANDRGLWYPVVAVAARQGQAKHTTSFLRRLLPCEGWVGKFTTLLNWLI